MLTFLFTKFFLLQVLLRNFFATFRVFFFKSARSFDNFLNLSIFWKYVQNTDFLSTQFYVLKTSLLNGYISKQAVLN